MVRFRWRRRRSAKVIRFRRRDHCRVANGGAAAGVWGAPRYRSGAARSSTRRGRRRRLRGFSSIGLLIAFGYVLGGAATTFQSSPWPMDVTARHLLAAPNCDAARSVGLAPARRGMPGYWSRHDADDDGIACEVWPRGRAADDVVIRRSEPSTRGWSLRRGP